MITFTGKARAKLLELLAGEGRQGSALRLAIAGRRDGVFQYRMAFVPPQERDPADTVVDGGGFEVVLDTRTAPHVDGTVVDYVESGGETGFRIDNPNPLWRDPVALAVQRLFDEEINPALASHGGFVHLLGVEAGVAYVELGGGCQGCGMAQVTLKRGIEARVLEAVPGVRRVADATDHAQGTHPFYGASDSGESPYA